MAERTGQTMIVVFSHNLLAERYAKTGEFALALPHMEQALTVAEQRQDPIHLAWQLRNFTRFLFASGDWQRARATSARASAIMREADRHGMTWHAAEISIWPGMLALAQGREEEGRRLLEQAMQRVERVGNLFRLDAPTCLLAEADLLAGRAEQAQLRLTAFLQTTQFTPPQTEALDAPVRLAWAEGALGQITQAEEIVATVLASAELLVRVEALRAQGLLPSCRGAGTWPPTRWRRRWDAPAPCPTRMPKQSRCGSRANWRRRVAIQQRRASVLSRPWQSATNSAKDSTGNISSELFKSWRLMGASRPPSARRRCNLHATCMPRSSGITPRRRSHTAATVEHTAARLQRPKGQMSGV